MNGKLLLDDVIIVRSSTDTIFHTHSVLAVLASLMETDQGEFSVSHLQMVKAMPGHKWSDTLRLPIIKNQDTEDGIAVELEAAVRDNPGVDALLIRGHGLYVWASSWRAAKVFCETFQETFHRQEFISPGEGGGTGVDISRLC